MTRKQLDRTLRCLREEQQRLEDALQYIRPKDRPVINRDIKSLIEAQVIISRVAGDDEDPPF